MYHMVDIPRSREEQKLAISPLRFAAHMRALHARGYRFVSLTQIQDYLDANREMPAAAVAVTLDDGFADNYMRALPILVRYEVPATVFLVVNCIGGDNRWMRERDYPVRRMLDWGQIREMQDAGICFGSHTLTHPRLSALDRRAARAEIQGSKQALEDRLGAAVDHFAYPYGDWSGETVELVREAGHTLACSTRSGFNRPEADPLLLRRIEVYGTDPVWKLLQKLRFGTNEAGVLEPARYYWRRASERLFGR